MAGGEQDAQRLEAQQKRAGVVELRREGLTFAEIGDRMGFTMQRAHALYRQALAAIVAPAVEAHRSEMLSEIREAKDAVLTVLRAHHVTVSNGRIVRNQDGTALADDGPVLDAARTLAQLQAREARLIGGDAPQQVQVEATHIGPADIELRGLIAEQRARNALKAAELKGSAS